MKLNVWKEEDYKVIKAAISPKKTVDLGNNHYYLIDFKGVMVMSTVPKKYSVEEAIQTIVVGISAAVERSKDTFKEKLKDLFTNAA